MFYRYDDIFEENPEERLRKNQVKVDDLVVPNFLKPNKEILEVSPKSSPKRRVDNTVGMQVPEFLSVETRKQEEALKREEQQKVEFKLRRANEKKIRELRKKIILIGTSALVVITGSFFAKEFSKDFKKNIDDRVNYLNDKGYKMEYHVPESDLTYDDYINFYIERAEGEDVFLPLNVLPQKLDEKIIFDDIGISIDDANLDITDFHIISDNNIAAKELTLKFDKIGGEVSYLERKETFGEVNLEKRNIFLDVVVNQDKNEEDLVIMGDFNLDSLKTDMLAYSLSNELNKIGVKTEYRQQDTTRNSNALKAINIGGKPSYVKIKVPLRIALDNSLRKDEVYDAIVNGTLLYSILGEKEMDIDMLYYNEEEKPFAQIARELGVDEAILYKYNDYKEDRKGKVFQIKPDTDIVERGLGISNPASFKYQREKKEQISL